jgi:hypothetical protein
MAKILRETSFEYKYRMKRFIAFYFSKRKKALILLALMIPLIFLVLLLLSLVPPG